MQKNCFFMLTELFGEEGIVDLAAIAYADCHILRPYLAERLSFSPQTAVLFLVPYYAGACEKISAYAAAKDYHLYMQGLFSRLAPRLAESGYSFAGFSDHSPIDERTAAAEAGLGVIGENGLLIHPRHGSYVFIGELLTDAPPAVMQAAPPMPIGHCEGCGACRRACPTGALREEGAPCLSAVTQKKGSLTAEEAALILKTGQVWGCDACQTVCPHNRRVLSDERAWTPISFFKEERLSRLTPEILSDMSEEAFSERAFSFRGREVLTRNLDLLYKKGASST